MKRRAWKGTLGIAALAAAALGGLLWSAHSRATAVFERHDRLVKDAIADLRSRPIVRAPFAALAREFEAIPDAGLAGLPKFTDENKSAPNRAQVEGCLERYAPLVERVKRLDRTPESSPSYRYEDGWAVDLPDGTGVIRAAQFFRDRADHLYQTGRRDEALESILLGLAVAHDTGRGGGIDHWSHQIACEGIVTYFVRRTLENHEFRAAELGVFAKKIDRLSTQRPTLADALRVEDLLDRRSLLNLEFLGNDAPSAVYRDREVIQGRSWRYLYSRRLAYAGALDELEQLYAASVRAASLPPPLQAEAAASIRSRLEASRNPVVRRIGPATEELLKPDLSFRMKWTLLRTAIAVAWFEAEQGKSPDSLADLVPKYLPEVPSCIRTGKPLVCRDRKVWWVGRNGVDDGGKAGTNDSEMDEDGDAVWHVKRK